MSSPGGTAKRKRNRIPLSCTICRKRKVRCDKTKPHCTQCVKTGVVHLCHYMEQSWAGEAEKELSKDAVIKQLQDRVKYLEKMFSIMHKDGTVDMDIGGIDIGGDTNMSDNLEEKRSGLNQQSPRLSFETEKNRYDDDELDLTRQFDMLHLKTNGTVHLGATHWLAIMKGDPYLRLLWGHLFAVREKLIEWRSHNKHTSRSIGTYLSSEKSLASLANIRRSTPTPDKPKEKCSDVRTCLQPVCPIAQHGKGAKKQEREDIQGRCPISGASGSNPSLALPSFQDFAARCPSVQNIPPVARSSPDLKSRIEGTYMSHAEATKILAELLPPKRIINMFLDRFFKYLYPAISILDEPALRNEVNQIILDSKDKVVIKVSKPTDYCTLGILTLILRLTWLSLPQNSCTIELGSQCSQFIMPEATMSSNVQAKDDPILIKYETILDAITLIRKHLIHFDELSSFSNTNVNLATVQFAIIYKIFLLCFPESIQEPNHSSFATAGQDNETHQILLSSIVQMAFSYGLHRDPDNFPQLNNHFVNGKLNKDAMASTERLKHTWRKIWFFIVSLDVNQSLYLGSPRLLRNLNDFSDTKLPSSSKIDYVKDIKELIVVKNFTLFFQIDMCIISVLNHILNVSLAKSVKKYQLDSLISLLRDLCEGKRSINDVLTGLINKGLLSKAEGTCQLFTDDIYTLPTMEQILYPTRSFDTEKDKNYLLPHEMTTNALFFSKHIMLRMLLFLLNYILFTQYEPKGNEDPGVRPLARKYAQEAMDFAMDGYCNSLLFFNSTKSGGGSVLSIFSYMEVLLTPVCLDMGHRALQFMVCLVLRAECGPLDGVSESPIVGNIASSSDDDESSSSEDKNFAKENSSDVQDDVTKPIRLDAVEQLADILMNRMVLFYKLTKQISSKYLHATRMAKSTGFFITLLTKPSQEHKKKPLDKNNLPRLHDLGISSITGFFKNVPSLVLSAGGESLRRCPVYQDAIGVLLPRKMSNTNHTVCQPMPTTSVTSGVGAEFSLPPIKAYQPITYTSNDLRKTSAIRGKPNKKRKVAGADPHSTSPIKVLQKSTSPSNYSSPEVGNNTSLPPPSSQLASGSATFNMISPSQSSSAKLVDVEEKRSFFANYQPPTKIPECSSSTADYNPDFEDFLMQSSNFNGLMINPSSIIEAVGFDHYGANPDPSNMLNTDLLPIDDIGIIDMQQNNDFAAYL
ncbi:Hap1p Ecym_2732 [Eremothecium cymbalariae DBVPG|uniref:Zn(2)-C6 fungal-type domain-containing protein n=1 Tax=Eremothecium cymbalariae (strain CBS 270.75 / DBVPG 7215 / KCTC 17166 / NRRL Y-17582) TaxID=931890 RepID=G8JPG7_ERECY|nr:Hypothetical protein Ecym_2732 [Eremothecium cymbalariae DBVPG\